jgi:hypothetical protein
MQRTQHFTSEEMACKCGCGVDKTEQSFLDKLEEARTIAGIPFPVNSGYRCPKHTQQSKNHGAGRAVDIACTDDRTRWIIVYSLIMAGFKRIGLAKTFIHADTMDQLGSAKAVWFY